MNGTSLRGLVESLGAEGFYQKVCQLLNEKQVAVDDFSYYELAEACGVLPSLRSAGRRMGGDGASNGSTTTKWFSAADVSLCPFVIFIGFPKMNSASSARMVTPNDFIQREAQSRSRPSRPAARCALAPCAP